MALHRRSFLSWLGLAGGIAAAKPELPELAGSGPIEIPAPITPLPSVPKPPRVPPIDISALMGQMVDRVPGALYDRVRFKAGESLPHVMRLFLHPVGDIDPFTNETRTFADTNMTQHGQLPAPVDMIVSRVLFTFSPLTSERDRAAVLSAFYYDWTVLCKTVIREPLIECSAVVDAENLVDLSGAKRASSSISRLGKHYARLFGDFCKYLPPLTTFGVTLRNDTDALVTLESDFEMYVYLDGIINYPVQ